MESFLKRRRLSYIIGILVLPFILSSFAFPVSAFAVTDRDDLVVGVKVLPLLSEKVVGHAAVAIIFDPVNPDSKKDATEIKSILEGNFKAPDNVELLPVLVPINNLALAGDSKIAVIADGMGKYYNTIKTLAIKNSILTMSTDLECVRANECVLGIISKPAVDIYYSRELVTAAKIGFSPIFTLLIKPI